MRQAPEMAHNRPSTTTRVDNDGVRVYREPGVRPAVWLAVFAVALLAVGLLLRRPGSESSARPDASSPAESPGSRLRLSQRDIVDQPAAVARPRPASARASAAASRDESEAPSEKRTRQPAPLQAQGQPADAADEDSDNPTGIAVFPPPGTKPIKRGIVVPDGFELPPGYVRHYQTTDDGRQLPPILMFHPDYKPVDERGEPIALPEDRVVPADMAPTGMDVRMLDVPDVHVPTVERQPAENTDVNSK
ncbi:MAG TPA: hypothetical protein VMT89_14970 [Candidatus Acidoferrales bacterium]|nr:hypothetical protein [Candidatus Acidoferrales bacterium]